MIRTLRLLVLLVLVLLVLLTPFAHGEDPVVRVDVLVPTDAETLEDLAFTVLVTVGSGNNTTGYSGPVDARIVQHDVVAFNETLEAVNGTASGAWTIPCERFVDDAIVIASVNVSGVVVEAQRGVDVHKSDECAQVLASEDAAIRRREDESRWGGIVNLVVALLLVVLFLAAVVILAAQSRYATSRHLPAWHEGIRARIGFWQDPLARALPPIAELSKWKTLYVDEVRALTNAIARLDGKRAWFDARLLLGERLVLRVGPVMPRRWVGRLKRSYERLQKFAHANALEVERLEDHRREVREKSAVLGREVDELRAMHDLPPEGEFPPDVSALEVRPAPSTPGRARPGGGNGG